MLVRPRRRPIPRTPRPPPRRCHPPEFMAASPDPLRTLPGRPSPPRFRSSMSTTNSSPTDFTPPPPDDAASRAVSKRYEGLVMVRTKAIKGKGAWYWAHLEPILVRNVDTSLPKVKLRCALCDSVFSASNPSRTASEHLKRGTCPNFSTVDKPISPASQTPPLMPSLPSPPAQNHKRRNAHVCVSAQSASYQIAPVAVVDPLRFCCELAPSSPGQNAGSAMPRQHLVLSGGKEDVGALALLEDSVKRLKSPKASPSPLLSKEQIGAALDLLAEWFYECCGSVSLSSLEHPKFRGFLGQVGLPPVSGHDFLGARLDSRFEEVRMESEARIRDAMFFQVASDGWKDKNLLGSSCGDDNLVKFTVNLPNGTSVFQKGVFIGGEVPSNYAEEVLWETITSTCAGGGGGGAVQRCVSIVADKYRAKALGNLEIQHHWMVNLTCQLQGFLSLVKDFCKQSSLFKAVISNCLKIAVFFNNTTQIRSCFRKYQLQELDHAGYLRAPKRDSSKSLVQVCGMMEEILSHARVLQLLVMDDSFKLISMEDPIAREVAEMIRDRGFWNELEAVHSLVKLITGMAQDIEAERPLIGQCLPLWEELRAKVRDWCSKYNIDGGPVEKIVDRRFKKNYHPAWSAAYVLDPLHLMRDASGKYLPPFKCLTHEQEKDVDKLVIRLVAREEAHIALMELMKWRSEGLDPLYAQAVQVKQQDPVTGKMKIANPQSSRLVWETCLNKLRSLGKVAVRLIFLHATSCGVKRNWPSLRWVCVNGHSRVGPDRAQKMIVIAAHAKLERREFPSEEERDAERFAMEGNEDEMLDEVFVDEPPV